jgi:hypothetical protein
VVHLKVIYFKITRMRTIQLTHEEIETIKDALQYAYNVQLGFATQIRNLIGQQGIDTIMEKANEYLYVQDIFNGDRDI